uniref:Iron-sulfur cluster assembly accessory protein n=1 Tax=uncultured marine bacterium 311 TaxID=257385 RepID=Q6SHR8_9BACT|nr:iron-sulfur cluster assembly accessory protein [uncultured marine bacterium 311]
MVETFNPSTLNLTEGAVNKIHSLSDSDKSKEINLRVYVTGGGCSGFQYGFSFDQEVDEEDTCVSRDGANLVIDPLSLQYLAGSTIDYAEDLSGSKFIVKNPNATTTCGCGESFSI